MPLLDVEACGSALLEQARELMVPALHGWSGQLPGQMGRLAGYHLGWLDAEGRAVDGPGAGKAVRPALAFGCARAVGAQARDAVDAAVAIELVHNFSLIHDDVIDRDELRRHRPAVWAAFGIPAALLSGDALLTLALKVLADAPGGEAGRAVGVLASCVLELVEGEAMDTAFEQRTDVTVAEYTAMAVDKTGALMGAACALGALAGGAGEARMRYLDRFGRHLGVAFQIMDDLLGLFGTAEATGKPVGSDLAARKKTYPVLAALASSTAAGERLGALYARPGLLDDVLVEEGIGLVEQAGGRQAAQRAIERELQCAFAALTAADPVPAALRDLTALAHLMTHRSG
ncbi:polyprenyl synthetase family protein [Streptomyces sp. NPDC020681]|uniref:polyprenyl synthetase family protein n=1 Tax=Streptomyces sp. NPDC020681 TaxID=3365083 RepID=UPI0037B006AC